MPAEQLHAAARAEHRHATSATAVGLAANGDVLVPAYLWPAVQLFSAVCTQWRAVAGRAGGVCYLGLDYSVLNDAMGWLGLDKPARRGPRCHKPRLLEQLATMERCALRVLNAVDTADEEAGTQA